MNKCVDREPTNIELDEIDLEYQSRLHTYPIETDADKSLRDWSDLIVEYAALALISTSVEESRKRFVQCGNLAARAARACRAGDFKKT